MRVLIIDCNDERAGGIAAPLRDAGHECDIVSHGEEGVERARSREHDIVLVELLLPDINGFDVLKRLRREAIQTPVVVITSLPQPEAGLKAFKLGADGFIVRPFDPRELLARIGAIRRRATEYDVATLRIGTILINVETQTVIANSTPLHLTRNEYQVLETLARRSGIVQTRETLLNRIYRAGNEPEAKVIDVYISRLRKKLAHATGEDYIKTDRGIGYFLSSPKRSGPKLGLRAKARPLPIPGLA